MTGRTGKFLQSEKIRNAIKIALSKLEAGEGSVIPGTFTKDGEPSAVTRIPIIGYTLYAEQIIPTLTGNGLEGRTIYIAPTETAGLTYNKSRNHRQKLDGSLPGRLRSSGRIVNG